MRINSKYPTRIKFVRKATTPKGTPITSFSTGEKIKGTDNYVNFNCTVFEDLLLSDGDEVVFTDITSVEHRSFTDKNGNDRVSYDIICKVKLTDYGDKPDANGLINNEPDDTSLPFDL